MERIQGKQTHTISAAELERLAGGYEHALVDLGTGDGKFVLHAARQNPRWLAIGIDACRENLRASSRQAPANALFLIANALALPEDFRLPGGLGAPRQVTINFPWGSLLDGLLAGSPALFDGLSRIAGAGKTTLEVRLNASALSEAGWDLASGGEQVYQALKTAGFPARPPRLLDAASLRACPTTWARRMAFGRRPEAVLIRASAG